MAQRSLDILRDWWRTQPNKFWPVVITVVVVTGVAIVAFGLIVLGADVVEKWQAGTLHKRLVKATGFWVLLGIVGAGVVLLLLFWVVVLLWAWITLPFTLQAGVLAVDRLRLEVEQLRRQMLPTTVDVSDDDLDLDDDVES